MNPRVVLLPLHMVITFLSSWHRELFFLGKMRFALGGLQALALRDVGPPRLATGTFWAANIKLTEVQRAAVLNTSFFAGLSIWRRSKSTTALCFLHSPSDLLVWGFFTSFVPGQAFTRPEKKNTAHTKILHSCRPPRLCKKWIDPPQI